MVNIMTTSILTSIKKLLGVDEADVSFDLDIAMHINSAFFTLNQLGIGPSVGYSISNKIAIWSDFIGSAKDLEAIKTYVYLKTRLVFDPPQMGYLVEAIKSQITELEWRLNVQIETRS